MIAIPARIGGLGFLRLGLLRHAPEARYRRRGSRAETQRMQERSPADASARGDVCVLQRDPAIMGKSPVGGQNVCILEGADEKRDRPTGPCAAPHP
jgi:hypothetical protein